MIQQGTTAFKASCVTCHDAEKSFQVTESLPAWRATVKRMAEKDGANIPENTHESIAAYLASLNKKGGGDKGSDTAGEAALPVTITGTSVSTPTTSATPYCRCPMRTPARRST